MDQEERRGFMEGIMEREIGRVARIKRMEERQRLGANNRNGGVGR